jgi:hypothetical protein
MHLQYKCTFDDFVEAQKAVTLSRRAKALSRATLFVMMMLVGGILIIAFLFLSQLPPALFATGDSRIVAIDVCLIFIPPALPPILILIMFAPSIAARFSKSPPESPKSIRPYKPAISSYWKRVQRTAFVIFSFVGWPVLISVLDPPYSLGIHGPYAPLWMKPGMLYAYHATLWFILILIATLNFGASRRVKLLRAFHDVPRFSENRTADITEQGIILIGAFSKVESAWTEFTKFVETANLFVLFVGDGMFYAIPRRAFGSVDEEGNFLGLLVEHIGNGMVLQRTQGFAMQSMSPPPLPKAS